MAHEHEYTDSGEPDPDDEFSTLWACSCGDIVSRETRMLREMIR